MKKIISAIIQTLLLPIKIWPYFFKKILSFKKIKLIEIHISGKLTETPPVSGMLNFIKPQSKKFYELIFELTDLYQFLSHQEKKSIKEKNKEKIEILLQIDSPEIGWGKTWELYSLLDKIKNTGVSIRAFLHSADLKSYILALSADEMYTSPAQNLNLQGLRIESLYFKELFDKWHIKPDFIHIGKFKSATERYTQKKGSSFAKKQLQEILNRFQNEIEKILFDSRKSKIKNIQSLEEIQNLSPMTVKEALELKLIDGILYEEVLIKNICKVNEWSEKIKPISLENALNIFNNKQKKLYSFAKKKKIALVVGEGVIVDSQEETPSMIGLHDYKKTFEKIKENQFDAYLFRWNSPGGSAVTSDLLWREIMTLIDNDDDTDQEKKLQNTYCDDTDKSQQYKFDIPLPSLKEEKKSKKKLKLNKKKKKSHKNNEEKKPFFVISQSDVAASGGYYLSAISKNIFTSPMSITGSIGVLAGKFNVSGLLKKLGITIDNVESGKNTDIYSPFKSFSNEQKKRFTKNMEDMYDLFRYRIHLGRNMDDKTIQKLGEGRVYAGSQAVENNLADYSGGLFDALLFIKKELNLTDKDKLVLDIYPKIKAPLLSKKELMPKFLSKFKSYIHILELINKEKVFFLDNRFL